MQTDKEIIIDMLQYADDVQLSAIKEMCITYAELNRMSKIIKELDLKVGQALKAHIERSRS